MSVVQPTRNGLEFLRDGRGIYGLGFRRKCQAHAERLIIRPEKFSLHDAGVALQQVPLKPRMLFRHSAERMLADRLHLILYEQSARLDGFDPDRGVGDLRESTPLRKKFYGCRAKAYRITNALIRRLLEEAADQRALIQARRFRYKARQYIYYLASRGDRYSQLCETFPMAALALASEVLNPSDDPCFSADDALDAVRSGQSLRHVAMLMNIPFVMKAVPPMAVLKASPFCDLFRRNPHLINRMPSGGRAASAWFDVLREARAVSPDFAEWCAKKIEITAPYGRRAAEVVNIGDWVRASYEKHIQSAIDDLAQKLEAEVPTEYVQDRFGGFGRHIGNAGPNLVTRTFKLDMSARTVCQLSEVWHDAVADQRFSGNSKPLPKAWAPKAEIEGYHIVPLETPLALYLEGRVMHNCVTTYEIHVRSGACYLFSMQNGGQRIATIEIRAASDGFRLAQLAGPCNQRLDKKTERIIRRWARTTKFVREKPLLPTNKVPSIVGGDLDDEIPF